MVRVFDEELVAVEVCGPLVNRDISGAFCGSARRHVKLVGSSHHPPPDGSAVFMIALRFPRTVEVAAVGFTRASASAVAASSPRAAAGVLVVAVALTSAAIAAEGTSGDPDADGLEPDPLAFATELFEIC